MEVTYTDHAVRRMEERNISTVMVHELILHPEGKIKQSRDKWIFYRSFKFRNDNQIAAVVVERKGDHWEVITVMIHFEVAK